MEVWGTRVTADLAARSERRLPVCKLHLPSPWVAAARGLGDLAALLVCTAATEYNPSCVVTGLGLGQRGGRHLLYARPCAQDCGFMDKLARLQPSRCSLSHLAYR